MRREKKRKHFMMRIAALFLTMVLILGLGASALAEEGTGGTDSNLTISGNDVLPADECDEGICAEEKSTSAPVPEGGDVSGNDPVTGTDNNTAGDVTEGENGMMPEEPAAGIAPLTMGLYALQDALGEPVADPVSGEDFVYVHKSLFHIWDNSYFALVKVTNGSNKTMTIKDMKVKDPDKKLFSIDSDEKISANGSITYIGYIELSNKDYDISFSYFYDDNEKETKEYGEDLGTTSAANEDTNENPKEIIDNNSNHTLDAGARYQLGNSADAWKVSKGDLEDPTEYIGGSYFYVSPDDSSVSYNFEMKG